MCDLYILLKWGIESLFMQMEMNLCDCIVLCKRISNSSATKYLTYVLSFPSLGIRRWGHIKKDKVNYYASRQAS